MVMVRSSPGSSPGCRGHVFALTLCWPLLYSMKGTRFLRNEFDEVSELSTSPTGKIESSNIHRTGMGRGDKGSIEAHSGAPSMEQ